MLNCAGFPTQVVLVFDLDDTLYPELTFVKSGFHAVATYLNEVCGVDADSLYRFMLEELRNSGRGSIFNSLKTKFGISQVSTRQIIAVYRSHVPEIRLYPESTFVLETLQKTFSPLYLLTDGNPRVQRSKIDALGLKRYFKRTYCTRDFGLEAEKPSTTVFERIALNEGVRLTNLVYIGDDPKKDFHGLIAAGGRAIRVRTGKFKSTTVSEDIGLCADLNGIGQLPEELRRLGIAKITKPNVQGSA